MSAYRALVISTADIEEQNSNTQLSDHLNSRERDRYTNIFTGNYLFGFIKFKVP